MEETNKQTRHRYIYAYPHPAVTTDCVVFGFNNVNLQILLIQRGEEPFKGDWALPGGFLRVEYKNSDEGVDDSAEVCAARELKEETGFDATSLTQFHTYSSKGRDPRERVITIAYYALVNSQSQEVRGGSDAKIAQWFNVAYEPGKVNDDEGADNVDSVVNSLPRLAFDHAEIIKDALKALRENICFEPIGFDLMPEVFTIPQLQKLYEVILGREFNRSNFRNKIIKYGLVDNVEGNDVKQSGRKAFKYRFNKEKYNELKQKKGFRLEF